MPVSQKEREVTYRRNLRRKRKASAERKKLQREAEKQERIKVAKRTAQEKEDARNRHRQELLAKGGKARKDGAVIPVKVNACGKIVPATGRTDGRTNKYLVAKLVGALRAGHTLADAAIFAGTNYQTVNKWLNQGAQADEGTLAKSFYDQVEMARAEAVGDCLQSIKKAAKKGAWQAAAWFLEKRVPEVYGKRAEVAVTQNKPFEIALVDAAFSESEMQAALKAVLAQHPELAPTTIEVDAEVVE